MARFCGMFLGRGFWAVGLLVAVGLICGCQRQTDVQLDGDSDSPSDSQPDSLPNSQAESASELETREWIDGVQKRSDQGVKDAARLVGEVASLEAKLSAARRESQAVGVRTKKLFASARTSAGPRPADRTAAKAWETALNEKLATAAVDGDRRQIQADKKLAVISIQIENTKQALNKARHYIRTPDQIAAETKRHKAFMTAVTRPGSWQLDQRVDELNFVNVNPREVLERLSTYANIVVNWQELTVLGASFDRPVTYNRRNVKLGEAIEKVLALASGNHYAIAVGSLGNAVVVSTPQGLKDSAMMYERTAGQVAGSPYKANKNMMAEKLDRIDMNDMELSQVLEFSGHLTDRKVQIDWDALKQHDITEDLVITVNLRKPAFALFLRLVLDQAGTGDVLLDAKVKEGSIIITPLSDQPAGKQTGK